MQAFHRLDFDVAPKVGFQTLWFYDFYANKHKYEKLYSIDYDSLLRTHTCSFSDWTLKKSTASSSLKTSSADDTGDNDLEKYIDIEINKWLW